MQRMRNVDIKEEKIKKEHAYKKRWLKTVVSLSVIVSLCMSYTLMIPAVTMTNQTYCGQREHSMHEESCYTEKKTLICDMADEGHMHSDECYEDKSILSCKVEESDGHRHTEDCLDEIGELICGLYEGEGAHHHDETCFTSENFLICDKKEAEPHVHNDDCFVTERGLTCTIPIHEHTLQCYSNPEADVENQSVWEREVSGTELSGDWRDDVIKIAETQLGYHESERNYLVQEDGKTKNGYTRYGDWYGDPYGDWCAMFCSFCLHYAGVDANNMSHEANCGKWIESLTDRGLYHEYESCYEPKAGDLIFMDWDGDGEANHVGFVYEVNEDNIKTIEGNKADQVKYDQYDLTHKDDDTGSDSHHILGYGELTSNQKEAEHENAETKPSDGNVAGDSNDSTDEKKEMVIRESFRNTRGSETTSLKVKKTWSDYWNAHDPIQVELLKKNENGGNESTGSFITLSEANNWAASFTGLDMPEDGQDLAYTVRETAVEGYRTQYGAMKEISASSGGDYWVPVSGNTLSSGEFVFLLNSTSNVMTTGTASSTYLTATSVTKNGQIVLNGTTYNSYLTGVPDAAVFTASASGSGFKLRNGTRFIRKAGFTTSSDSATTWTFNSSGALTTRKDWLVYRNSRFIYDDDYTSQKFTLYKRVTTGSVDRSYEIGLTNIKVGGEQYPIISQADLNKSIDYLGDGVINNDTDIATTMTAEELKDFYRLYLSVESTFQAIDLLIVSDVTNSMDKTDMSGRSRKAVLDEVVNGTILSGSGETAQRRDDGVAYQFLSLHPDNKIACICFSGGWDSSEHGKTYNQVKDQHATLPLKDKYGKNWVKKSEMMGAGTTPRDCYVRVTKKNEPGGTNYETPLMRADEVLNEVKNDGNLKVMVFLTDGEPNTVFDPGITQSPRNTTVLAHTETFFKDWIAAHEGIITYIVGVSPDANTGEVYSTLTRVADAAHGVYYTADTKGDLENSLQDIINRSKLSLVQVNDDISEYVEYYGACPDLKVEMTNLDGGNKVCLWENGRSTIHNATEDGISILSDVVVETPGEGKPGGQIKVVYNKECRLDGTHKFILSYNVKIADSAGDTFFANEGYGTGSNNGDDNTDYLPTGNNTSIGKEGFRSNDHANMTYTTFDIAFDKDFNHPVVQVPSKSVYFIKEDGNSESTFLENVTFDLYRITDSSTSGAVTLPDNAGTYALKSPTEIITDDNGSAEVTIPNGTYYMYETSAPKGYSLLNKPIAFEVKSSGIHVLSGDQYVGEEYVRVVEENGTIRFHIKNFGHYELPSTGGIGTWWFTVIGTCLMSSAVMYISRRRKER